MFKLSTKEIHIFDIDGCIFPARNGNGEHIMPTKFKSKNTTKEIIEIINRMKEVELFSSFIDFYKFVNNNVKQVKNYYITGRDKKNFQIITLEQLSILNTIINRDTIIFFPDKKPLTKKSYYNFKFTHILKIITDDNGLSKINIYDDRFQHYNILKEKLKDNTNDIHFYMVKEPEQFWDLMLKKYKDLIKSIDSKKRGWRK